MADTAIILIAIVFAVVIILIVGRADMKDYTNMTDTELRNERAMLPKYTNDSTPEQIAAGKAIYDEQTRRYKMEVEEYNQAATAATSLKHGDRVTGYFNGLFGTSNESVTGMIIHDKTGRLAVKYDKADGTGKKIGRIHKGLKKIY